MRTRFTNGQCHGTRITPSASAAGLGETFINARLGTPISGTLLNAVNLNPAGISPVSHRRRMFEPSNIARLVMAVIVDAIQFVVSRRSIAQLGKELVEGVETKSYSSAAVFLVMILVRVVTAPLGVLVGVIFRSAAHTVLNVRGYSRFYQAASAGCSNAADKITGIDSDGVSTVALTAPKEYTIDSAQKADNGEIAESLAFNIFKPKVCGFRLKHWIFNQESAIAHIDDYSTFLTIRSVK